MPSKFLSSIFNPIPVAEESAVALIKYPFSSFPDSKIVFLPNPRLENFLNPSGLKSIRYSSAFEAPKKRIDIKTTKKNLIFFPLNKVFSL